MAGYKDLAKQFAEPSDMEENNNFQKLPAQTAQWTIKKVKQSWASFFGAMRSYKKNPELFNGVPKPPKYKHKNTKRMDKIYMVRNRKIRDVMHKLSNAVILYAMNNEIDTIVIDHNNGWKQSVDIGKKNKEGNFNIP